jgi:hypothetical protein
MNDTIWKFPLRVTDEQAVDMPIGAEILSVQTQHDIPCIWALVNPKIKSRPRVFNIFGTGHEVPAEKLKFVGSFQVADEDGAFHLFEKLPFVVRQ